MNSRTGVEPATQSSEAGNPPAIASDSSAEIETVAGTAFPGASQRGGLETILLVEDEAFVRNATAEILESAGYRLMIAGGAAEALEACRTYSEPIDLLLADMVMPAMNGRELATKFEILCPRARVLLMSGYPEQLALCELSAYDKKYMAKPFTTRMLLRRVREVLEMNPPDFRAQA